MDREDLADMLFDPHDEQGLKWSKVPGVNLIEWLLLCDSDWNEVDAFLLEYETIGGG